MGNKKISNFQRKYDVVQVTDKNKAIGEVSKTVINGSTVAERALTQIGNTTGYNLVASMNSTKSYPVTVYNPRVTALSTVNYFNSYSLAYNNNLYYNGRKVYTGSELNQLGRGDNGSPNRGVEYMYEKPVGNFKAQEFQWGTTGSMMQKVDGEARNVIPALRYDNSNPRGMNFIKFDGIEVVDNQTYLIDAKRNIPYWNQSAMNNYTGIFDRINRSKLQNPDIKIVYEFPDEKAMTKLTDWLEDYPQYQNTIDVIRVRARK